MNKKIRYAIGAVGAVPVLAMIPGQFAAPAAHAGKTAETTGKKVRTVYATDTAVFAPTSTISSTSPAISPNVGSCRGTNGHHVVSNSGALRFYSAPEGTRTCIGTIQVSTPYPKSIGGGVNNINTVGRADFCSFRNSVASVSHIRCRRIFIRDKLSVSGFITNGLNINKVLNMRYPFRDNGFGG